MTGWGEAPAGATWGGAAMRYYGETPLTVRHIIDDYLAPALAGCDPVQLGVIHDRMDKAVKGHPYAKAAIDMACYDAAGKALGVSVADLLGGRLRPGIEVTHSLGIMDLDRCYAEAEQAVAEGARTLKCKTGVDPERDVTLVRELRRLLGPEVKIRVDANEGYASVHEAIRTTRRQEEFGLLLCEQPVAGAANMARVARRIDSPVMADESAWTVQDILELDQLDAAACFSCYVTKPGGLFRARQQAEVAGQLGMLCDIGGSIETGIGNAANLALGVSMPNATLPSVCPVSRPARLRWPGDRRRLLHRRPDHRAVPVLRGRRDGTRRARPRHRGRPREAGPIRGMTTVALLGAGAGGLSCAVELTQRGHRVRLWNRNPATVAAFRSRAIPHSGVLGEGAVEVADVTTDLKAALDGADVAVVCLPALAHAAVFDDLAELGCAIPVVLNPGHTGGALHLRRVFAARGVPLPPVAELSTLTYVARRRDGVVRVTGRARTGPVRHAARREGRRRCRVGPFPDGDRPACPTCWPPAWRTSTWCCIRRARSWRRPGPSRPAAPSPSTWTR